jgi:hypothetical protein
MKQRTLWMVLVSIVLTLSIIAQKPGDAWSEQNFKDSFQDNPAEGFNQNPERAWQTLEANPNLLQDPRVLLQAFADASRAERAAEIINGNIHLLNDLSVLREFDSAVHGNVNIVNSNPQAKERWLEKQYGIAMTSSSTKIESYDGNRLTTSQADFNPEELPPGQYEIQTDGRLEREGAGAFGGAIVVIDGNLITDGSFQDTAQNRYNCQVGCLLHVNADGVMNQIEGEAEVQMGTISIPVRYLKQVTIDGGLLMALPYSERSMIDEAKLSSVNLISYDVEGKILEGSDIIVYKTDSKTLFMGSNIEFSDSKGRSVANLNFGETRFSRRGCSVAPCISATENTIQVLAKGSEVSINGEGYQNVLVSQISDDSKVTLIEGSSILAKFNKNGMHPRPGMGKSELDVKYGYERKGKKATTHASTAGMEVCVEKDCSKATFGCIIR